MLIRVPGWLLILTYLVSRILPSLSCDNIMGCDDEEPAPKHNVSQAIQDLKQEIQKLRSQLQKQNTTNSPELPQSSQHEAILKSLGEIREMMEHSIKPAQSENKLSNNTQDKLNSTKDTGQCSHWFLKNVAALMTASRSGNTTAISALVSAGIPVDLQDQNGAGRTALHWAVDEGKLDAVKQLLKSGAAVDRSASGISKNTALHVAASRGNLDIVKALVENGADVTKLNSECLTPVELSNMHGHQDVSQWLQQKAAEHKHCKSPLASSKSLTQIPTENRSTPSATSLTSSSVLPSLPPPKANSSPSFSSTATTPSSVFDKSSTISDTEAPISSSATEFDVSPNTNNLPPDSSTETILSSFFDNYSTMSDAESPISSSVVIFDESPNTNNSP